MTARPAALAAALLFAAPALAQPQNYFWDPSKTTGNWTGDSFWSTPTAGDYTAPWNNTGHVANFSGTNQTITVSSSVFVANVGGNGINITGDGLLINGSGVLDVRGVDVSAGNSATIATTVSPSSTVFTKNGLGTLTLSGANTYSGSVTVNAGTLKAGSTSAFGDSGNSLRVESGATIDLNGFDATIGAIDTNGFGTITNSSATAATLTINSTIGSGFGGTLTGNLALIKSGGFLLTLNSANSYTGGTTINGGSIQVSNNGSLGSTTGTLTLGGSGTLFLLGSRDITVGALSGSGTITGDGTSSLTANNGGASSSFSGVIQDGSGTMSFTKAGAGTLTLSGTSTYTGATTFNGGIVAIESLQNSTVNSNLGAGSSLVFDGGTLQYANTTTNASSNRSVTLNAGGGTFDVANAARTVTLSGQLTGAGSWTKTGAGTLSLTNSSSNYTGATIINGGTLAVTGTSNGSGTSTIGASTAVAGNLVLNGGTLRASGNFNTNRLFTLGVSGGTLDGGGVGTVMNFSNTGAIEYAIPGTARTLTLAGDDTSATSVLALIIGDAGTGGTVSVTKTGAGEWTLQRSTNSYTGVTTISGGTLSIPGGLYQGGENSPLGLSPSTPDAGLLVLNGGTLRSSNSFIRYTNRLFTLGPAGGTLDGGGSSEGIRFLASGALAYGTSQDARTLTLTGDNSTTNSTMSLDIGDAGAGAVGITKTGTGTWLLNGIGAGNTYSGPTNIVAGTLLTDTRGTSANSAYTVASGAQFNVGGTNPSIGSLAGAGTVRSNSIGGALSIGADGTNTVFSGVLETGTNALAVTKVGAGTLTLSGANTYTGATTVSLGTLRVNGSLAAASAVAVNGGSLGGIGNVNGTVAVNAGGTVAPGNSIGTLNVGSTTWAGGGGYAFEYNPTTSTPTAGTDNDLLKGLASATLTLNNTSGNKFNLVLSATGGTPVGGTVTYRFAEYDSITGAAAGDVSSLFNVTGVFLGTPVVTLTDGGLSADFLTVQFTPAPEPGLVLGLAAAGLGLARVARRRRGDDPEPRSGGSR